MDRYVPLARTLPGDQSLFSGGLKAAGDKLKDVYATDQGINTVSDFTRYWQDYLASQDQDEEATS